MELGGRQGCLGSRFQVQGRSGLCRAQAGEPGPPAHTDFLLPEIPVRPQASAHTINPRPWALPLAGPTPPALGLSASELKW